MSTHDPFDLSADLPPPHESEPASLRQDILDELADHLACSLRREAVLTPDENQARRNVLKRFGNPAQVARKLWRDAMWEKIMLQRLSLGLSLVSMMAIVVVGLVLWRMVEQASQAQAAMLKNQELTIQTMLDRVLAAQESVVPQNASWAPLDVLLVSESGEPVTGNVVIKNAGRLNERPTLNLQVSSDTSGMARLGQIPWGEYDITVTLPDLNVTTKQNVYFRPGEIRLLKIVCPTSVPESVVRFHLTPTKEQLHRGDAYLVTFSQKLQTAGRVWSMQNPVEVSAIVDSEGHIVGRVLSEFQHSEAMKFFDDYLSNIPVSDKSLSRLFDLSQREQGNMESYLKMLAGVYQVKQQPLVLRGTEFQAKVRALSHLKVLSDPDLLSSPKDDQRELVRVIALSSSRRGQGVIPLKSLHPDDSGVTICEFDTSSPQWREVEHANEQLEQMLTRYWVTRVEIDQSVHP